MAFYYLFDFITREVGNINVILEHLLLKVADKKLCEEEA